MKNSIANPVNTPNPAQMELTAAQNAVLIIVRSRQERGETITSTNVTQERGLKDRSSSYRVLKSLIEKGLIENYGGSYYKIAEIKT